ncbi:hypothetical protein [Nocardioides marmoribigeumensis]|uniref:Uncharacterized protein n=1 Tax=Nocardioides marmoribigeumensis TaxID=433649 RepID=A0ABU2BQZ1_9ACTN|nr:hypothetical protein [Nocardioides marmoribigeumensis]MDR7361058.1 hypothetical protein [Nocardioides marmoribigeumensis]
MISHDVAVRLSAAGLAWTPANADRLWLGAADAAARALLAVLAG